MVPKLSIPGAWADHCGPHSKLLLLSSTSTSGRHSIGQDASSTPQQGSNNYSWPADISGSKEHVYWTSCLASSLGTAALQTATNAPKLGKEGNKESAVAKEDLGISLTPLLPAADMLLVQPSECPSERPEGGQPLRKASIREDLDLPSCICPNQHPSDCQLSDAAEEG